MIRFSNVLPIPLKEMPNDPIAQSEIFGKEIRFERGKKYLVTAPSGKGKSTFLHLMYGLRNDFEGEIFIDNQATKIFKSENWSEFRQQKFSIVFQDLRLFPNLTAIENILLKSKITEHKTESEIREMAENLGINTLLEKSVYTLSYGQRQRVALIRALCQPFDFLFLDEPFSHLDAENIKIASELIEQEIFMQQAALILVSLGETYHFSYDFQYKI